MTVTEREPSRFHTILELPIGSLIVERYEWQNPAAVHGAKKGVQWLAQVVDKDGDLALVRACKTRREALEVLRDA